MHLFLYVLRALSTLWFLSGVAAVGCVGGEYEVKAAGEGASLEGEVQMDDHPSGGNMVTLELEGLPPPQTHGGQYESYVVWMRPMGLDTLKAGELGYHVDQRVGLMRMVTPYESFELLVTAEPDATVAQPSRKIVARRIVQRTR